MIGTWPRLKFTFYAQNLVLQNRGLGRLGHTGTPDALSSHTKSFAAECGPDPFGHTRALEGPFFDPKTQNPV